jgi:Domain of unknown function (DUF5658)
MAPSMACRALYPTAAALVLLFTSTRYHVAKTDEMVFPLMSRALSSPGYPVGATSSGQAPWRRRPVTRVCWLLLILFAAFQIADVVTTNYALAVPGVLEANPLIALMQSRLGAAWWLPKAAVAGFVCLATPLVRRRWAMILAVSYSAVAVSINLTHL